VGDLMSSRVRRANSGSLSRLFEEVLHRKKENDESNGVHNPGPDLNRTSAS